MICMLLIWAFHDWRADGWTVAGSLIFLFVAILVCVSTLDPVLLETGRAWSPYSVLLSRAISTHFKLFLRPRARSAGSSGLAALYL